MCFNKSDGVITDALLERIRLYLVPSYDTEKNYLPRLIPLPQSTYLIITDN